MPGRGRRGQPALIHFSLEKNLIAGRGEEAELCLAPERNCQKQSPWSVPAGKHSTPIF